MLLALALVALGLTGLVVGGHFLVTGASGLAARLGVSPLVIGLTVVAFGTSAPELAVNLTAALQGSTELGFGNVIGSNLANMGLILGITVLVKPLDVQGTLIRRELPLLLLATCMLTVVVADGPLRGTPGVVDRADGLVLLLLFCVFVYALAGDVLRKRDPDPQLVQAEASSPDTTRPAWLDVIATVGGMAVLIAGGNATVHGATEMARGLGVSEAVIGLTIVAVGTSLPELVASLIAARRGEADLALGNVVGSNLFNLLLVLGATGTVTPVTLPEGGAVDVAVVLGLTILLLPMAMSHGRKLLRWEGAFLLVVWLAHNVWRATSGGASVA